MFFQSEVCKKILKDLGQTDVESEKRKVIILSQESFYRDLNEDESLQANVGNFNFDHPGWIFFISTESDQFDFLNDLILLLQ